MDARKWSLVGTLFIGIITLCSSLAPPVSAITYYACQNNSSGTIKMVTPGTSCKNHETMISWNDVGPEGPPGSSGLTVVLDNRWSSESTHLASAWSTVPASVAVGTTQGGPLMILMDLSFTGGSHAVCQPIIDEQWAGDYSGQAKPTGPFWVEGVIATGAGGGGYRKWATSRLYMGVPSGTHTFAIQCATDGGTLSVNGPDIYSSWTVLELR